MKTSLSISPIFVYIIKNNVIVMFLVIRFYCIGIIFIIKENH